LKQTKMLSTRMWSRCKRKCSKLNKNRSRNKKLAKTAIPILIFKKQT
jgi:hypothetical protein